MPTLDELNSMPDSSAATALRRCCGSDRWVEAMLAARPFESEAALFSTAERIWFGLDPDEWRLAFAAHPRIGARNVASKWSKNEQSGAAQASADVLKALALGNDEYERRFGWIFLICATGKNADELLAALVARLQNDADAELRVAAAEHARITHLRLEKLLCEELPGEQGAHR